MEDTNQLFYDDDATVTSYELGRAFAACCRGISAAEAFELARLPAEYREEFSRGVESMPVGMKGRAK